jgi:hypothetical protein
MGTVMLRRILGNNHWVVISVIEAGGMYRDPVWLNFDACLREKQKPGSKTAHTFGKACQ